MPLSFCLGQRKVSKQRSLTPCRCLNLRPEAVSSPRGEGDSAPRLKACLFDIAISLHYLYSHAKPVLLLSVRAYSQCFRMLFFSWCACFYPFTTKKRIGETYNVLKQQCYPARNYNEVPQHVLWHLCQKRNPFERKPREKRWK